MKKIFSFATVLLAAQMVLAATAFSAPTKFRNSGVQVQEYMYDYSVDGGAVGTLVLSAKPGKKGLPVGAVIKSVTALVQSAVLSGSTATVEWGDNVDTDGFSGTALAPGSLTANTVVNGMSGSTPGALIWDNTNDAPLYPVVTSANTGKFTMTINAHTLTGGKIAFMVEYLNPSQE